MSPTAILIYILKTNDTAKITGIFLACDHHIIHIWESYYDIFYLYHDMNTGETFKNLHVYIMLCYKYIQGQVIKINYLHT